MSKCDVNLQQDASGSLEQNELTAETSSTDVLGIDEAYEVYILE